MIGQNGNFDSSKDDDSGPNYNADNSSYTPADGGFDYFSPPEPVDFSVGRHPKQQPK